MVQNSGLILAGGFIRAAVAGEKISDIDLFISSAEQAENLSVRLAEMRNCRRHVTPNAITICGGDGPKVQFIYRWTFVDPRDAVKSFDFSISRAAVWYDDFYSDLDGICDVRFYRDLAARRLTYMAPERNEDAGASLLRMRKFLARGYTISAYEMAKVVARMVVKMSHNHRKELAEAAEPDVADVLTHYLRLIDPSTAGNNSPTDCDLDDEG